MFSRAYAPILSCLALLCLAASPSAALDSGVVAVINLERVFEQSDMVSHRSAQLRSLGQEVQGKLEELTEELENLQVELDVRPRSHPRYGEYRERLEVAKLRRELYRERQTERLQRREMELLRQSYEDLREMIKDFARERELSMVLLNSDSNLEAPNVQALRIQLAQRAVLYHRSDLNVTADFVAFANSRFRGSEEGRGAAAAAETEGEAP